MRGPNRGEKEVAAILLAALERHCHDCERCNGPDDGCDFGAGIEHLMLEAHTDAYALTGPERTAPLSQAVLRVMSGRAVV